MSWFSDKVMDDWLGFDPPNAPAPIQAARPDMQEVISAGDRARKRKTTQTNLGGGFNSGQPSISASVLYGL